MRSLDVDELERRLEKAIATALRALAARAPDPHTLHMMAKAAASVYEATQHLRENWEDKANKAEP